MLKKSPEKRKLEQTVSKPTKKKKVSKDEYTEVHFKVEIKDPNVTFAALEKFLSLAEQYLETGGYDIVSGYCRSSEECMEILQLLDGGKRKPSEVQLIFECLECILLRLVDDLTQYQVVGQNIVKKIWGSCSGSIYSSLSPRNKANQIKTTLKLLTTMTMLNETSAKAVLAQVDFSNENIQALYNRRDRKDTQDVRTCLLHFILGFLLNGSDSVIRQLLDTRALSAGLFSGLTCDKIETVQLVLTTLLEKVIQNPVVSKTQKVRVFTEENMRHLGNLYHWKGVHGIKTWKKFGDKSQEETSMETDEDVNQEEKQLAEETVHKVLMELCTSYKHGIIFFDKAFGTSHKNQNHILTSFMVSLSNVLETALQQELIVKALVACPDQLQYYLPSLQTSVTPRMSDKWTTAMAFLSKIFECQPDNFNVPKIREMIATKKLIVILLTTVLPPHQLWQTISQGLKSKELAVRHVVLDFLKLVLQRMTSLLRYTAEQPDSLKSLYKQEEWSDVIKDMKQEAAKTLPDIQTLLSCWEKLFTHNEDQNEEVSGPVVSVFSNMIRLEQVISLYQEVFPFCLTDNPAHISMIMEGVRTVSDQTSEGDDIGYLPQLYLLKLLAGADSKKLPWVKESQQGHSLMYLLLSMVPKLRTKPRLLDTFHQLICQLLVSTGLFDMNQGELSLWIRHFTRMMTEAGDKLTEFVSKVFTVFISNPYPYSDRVNEIVSGAMEQKGADNDSDSMVTSDLDALLEMEEEDIDTSFKDDSAVDQNRFPFSPLIVVGFETYHKDMLSSKVVTEYFSNVLCDLFHCQLNPVPLICFIQAQKDVPIDQPLCHYIKSFLPESPAAPMEFTVQSLVGSLTLSLHSVFVSGVMNDEQTIVSQLSDVTAEDVAIATQQLLLYITHTLKYKKDKCVKKMVPFYFKCIGHLVEKHLHKTHLEEISKSLPEERDGVSNPDTEDVPQDEETNESTVDMEGSNSPNREGTESTSYNDMIQQLSLADKSSRDIVHDIFTSVLDHPVIQEYFLLVTEGNKAVTKGLPMSTTSHVLTSSLCGLVKNLSEVNLNLTSSFEVYVQKLEYLFQNVSTVKANVLSRIIKDVQSVLSILVRDLSARRSLMLLETILRVPKEFLKDGDKLSVLGGVGVDLVCQIVDSPALLPIDKSCVQYMFSLHQDIHDDKLSLCCDKLLRNQPQLAIHVDAQLVQHFITSTHVTGIAIAENLVLHSIKVAECFKKGFMKGIYNQSLDMVIPLIIAVLGIDDDKKFMTTVCKKYKPFIDNWGDISHMTAILIKNLAGRDGIDKSSLFSCYLSAASVEGLTTVDQLDLLRYLGDKDSSAMGGVLGDKDSSAMVGVLGDKDSSAMVGVLVHAVNTALAAKENTDHTFVDSLMDRLLQLIQDDVTHCELEYKLLYKFIKGILKNRFKDKRTYQVIVKLVGRNWPNDLPLTTLYEMLMSLSFFLPLMFEEKYSSVKDAMCDLLLCLVEADPACCSTNHYSVFLGAYGATLSDPDQKLLKLMFLYEKNGCAITEYKPYLWGPKSIEHYSIQKTIGPSLFKKASADQILENFNENKLQMSILNFPLRRKLQNCTVQNSKDCKSLPDVYDPCFILPLFAHLLSPDQLIDCRKFISKGCLGYIIAALSCHDNATRGAAYFVLDSFLHHLEGSRFQEKSQVLYVIDLLRNSVETANKKLLCTITIFLSKVTRLMLRPEQHMYQMINSFLYLKPTIDVTNVPEFYKLFNSSTLEYKEERGWMLTLLLDSLRETADYRTYEKRYIFKLLLSYFDTATSDLASQELVLKIVHKACKETTVAIELTKNHGIVSWLINVISTSENKRFEMLTDIVYSLWRSMLGNKQETTDGKARFLPPSFSREMCMACKQLLKLFSNTTDITSAEKLLETMESILQHLEYTCTQLKVQGHRYIAPILTLVDINLINNAVNQLTKWQPRNLKTDETSDQEIPVDDGIHKFNLLALKVVTFWSPYGQMTSEKGMLTSCNTNNASEMCLQLSSWMLNMVKCTEDWNMTDHTLTWILKVLQHLTGTEMIKTYVMDIMEQLIQLYSHVVSKCKGEVSTYSSSDLINNILVVLLEKTSDFSETTLSGLSTVWKHQVLVERCLEEQRHKQEILV